MNKTIKTELALAVIVIFATALGIFSLAGDKQIDNAQDEPTTVVAEKAMSKQACEHYYEGEAQVAGWLVSADDGDLVVQLARADLEKMPKTAQTVDNSQVKLVDASPEIKKSLEKSSSEKPVSITIKGYATVCNSAMPLISLEPATIAFKKS
ncbi:MAG: hypothetical protein WC238_00070 [Parcubacteria group bacterium]